MAFAGGFGASEGVSECSALYGAANGPYWESSERQNSTHSTLLKNQNTKTALNHYRSESSQSCWNTLSAIYKCYGKASTVVNKKCALSKCLYFHCAFAPFLYLCVYNFACLCSRTWLPPYLCASSQCSLAHTRSLRSKWTHAGQVTQWDVINSHQKWFHNISKDLDGVPLIANPWVRFIRGELRNYIGVQKSNLWQTTLVEQHFWIWKFYIPF